MPSATAFLNAESTGDSGIPVYQKPKPSATEFLHADDPVELLLDQKAREMRPRWQDLAALGLPELERGPVEPPMAAEGAEGTPAPTEISQEDIEAQKNLTGIRAADAEDEANIARRKLARLIEEALFTPSAAPVEGGKMQPLISKEVAAVPLSIAPSRTVAHFLGGKYPKVEADMRDWAAEQASGFTNPDTLASLPGFIIPGVKEAFAIGQMAGMPEKVGTIKEAIQKHGFVSGETGRGIGDLVLSALMAAGAAHGGGIRGPLKQRTGTRWDQASGASPVLPGGPRPMPELGPYGPPMPQVPGTVAGDVSRALERRFTLKDQPRPQTEVAPTVDQGLAATEQPPVTPAPTTADITRQILDNRKRILNRIAEIQPQAERARQVIGGGYAPLERELAQLHAELNNKETNPVVHAPPETGTVPGLKGEGFARVAPEITAQKPPPSPAESVSTHPEAPAGSGQRPAQQTQPIPPEHAGYVPPGTPVAQVPVKPGLVGTLETKAAEARVRLREKLNKLGSAPDVTILSDLAIIGAYHITRLGRDFGRWVKEMTKEIGERDSYFWRQLYDKSLTQLKEEGQKAEFLKEKAKESRSRLDLSKPENFNVVDHAIPIGEVAKNEEFLLVDSNGEAHRGMIDRKLNVNPELFDISPPQKQQYRRPSNLLGTGIDPKTVKGEKFNVRTFIMYLAAHVQAGIRDASGKLVNICKFATKDCAGGCLGKGGMGTFDSTKIARANKTKFFHYDKPVFNMQLHKQITKEKARAQADGKQFAVRLNGTSDVLWEQEKISGKNLMELHPDVQFYDYTKYPATSRQNLPDNYHMTYSYTGKPGSDAFSLTWAERGVNTAVVFGNGMPAEFLGRPVIDGDVTDLRFRDPKGVIVGLHAKGPLLKLIGQSDFIYDTPPGDVAIPYIDPRTKARLMKNDMLGEDAVDSIKDAAPAADKLKYKRGNPFLGENVKTELPDWARKEMEQRGLDPARTFNDIDLQNPSVVEAIRNDPTLSPEQKASLLKTGSTESLAPVTSDWREQKRQEFANQIRESQLAGKSFGIPEGMIEEGLNTEHPEVANLLEKYTHEQNPRGLTWALEHENYPHYHQDLQRLLIRSFGNKPIPVIRIEGYEQGAHGQGVGDYMSVSTNPMWGQGAKQRGGKVIMGAVDPRDVVAAGGEAEGELIIKKGSMMSMKDVPMEPHPSPLIPGGLTARELPKRVTEKGFLERKADEARANRAEKQREGRQMMGLDPTDLTDLAWIMADHLDRHGYDRFKFEDAAIAESGPGVAIHLDDLFKKASELVDLAKAAPFPAPPPAEPGTSKIGRSIEAKAVEAQLTRGFSGTAEYTPLTIKDQSERATALIRDELPRSRAIIRGEESLPSDLHGVALITAMEEHLLRHPDADLAYELANSPLTSATSVAAQDMRLMRERVPDSLSAAFADIKADRAKGSKARGETPVSIKADIFKEVVKNSKRQTWEEFVAEIIC